MIITDSGLHIWQAPSAERPWDIAKAHLKEPMGYEDLRIRMAEAGVDRAVLVPPSFAGGYNAYSIEAAAHYPDQFAVMATVKLNKPEARDQVKDLIGQPGVLGFRLTFHHDYDEGWIADGTADWFWPLAEQANVPVMMNAPSILKDVAGVAMRYPGLRLIIDHMGRAKGMKDDRLGEGLAETVQLARHPNIYVKLTMVPDCSTQAYPYRNIHPHIRRLIEAYEPRRCFWGTDLSGMLRKTSCTYPQAVTLFTEEMDFLSAQDLEWIMGRGLAECLAWPAAAGLLK